MHASSSRASFRLNSSLCSLNGVAAIALLVMLGGCGAATDDTVPAEDVSLDAAVDGAGGVNDASTSPDTSASSDTSASTDVCFD